MTNEPQLKKALELVKKHVSSPRGRGLKHLRSALARLKRDGFALRFGELEEQKESAHFDLNKKEIVVDENTRGLPVEMLACLLVHEVQHAYDEFEGRPYTLEAELRSFKAEAVFMGTLDAETLSLKVKDSYAWRWFGYLYETRVNLLKGDLDFESAAARQFIKTHLGEAQFDGLQSIPKLLVDTRDSLRYKEGELKHADRELVGANGRRAAVLERIAILRADLAAGRRLAQKLESEAERNRRFRMPLD